ncbi:MAG TPA: SagB family peptide dehydrogenase [Actinoplanes sp.]|nr:SagB family peptide dehydrogenase [Actinoplanes sp.]
MTATGNRDLTIGEHYLRRTVYQAEELFAQVMREEPIGADPSPFKIYREVRRFALPGGLPEEPAALDGPLTERDLSTLLFYGYGFARHDVGPGAVWPYHRMVPSARCYFPTELYLWLPATGGLPAGVYHYDPLHHALALLRAGDFRAELARILGAPVGDVAGVLLLSSLFWKNAFKYRGYSYRLCAQEVGMVAGNTERVAGSLGLHSRIHYQFLDRAAGRLLGLDDSEEHLFAALVLEPGPAGEAGGPAAPVPELVTEHVRPEGPRHAHDPLFRSIADNCLLADPAEFRQETGTTQACTDGSVLPVPAGAPAGLGLGAALRSRTSGNVLFNPVPGVLPIDAFRAITGPATAPYRCDLRPGTAVPGITMHVVARSVDGLAPGVHRFCPEHAGLHPVKEADLTRPLQGALPVPNINLLSSAMVVYLSGDYTAASRTFGNRAYRILNLEAGVVAQRLCLDSAAHGLSARVHNGYDAALVAGILGLDETGLTPFFQIAVAHNRPGVQVGLPIMF